MFNKDVYIRRRKALIDKLSGENGIVLFLGNADAPAQYADNCYKWRQESSWLYFFGIDEPKYAAIIDLDNNTETIFADDPDLDDIIWTGPLPSVKEQAEAIGIYSSEPYCKLDWAVSEAIIKGRRIHTIPYSRYYNKLKLQKLGVDKVSEALVKAIIQLRLVKEDIEIKEIDDACTLGQQMHTIARRGIKVGTIEQDIVGEMEGFSLSKGWGVSFQTILTQHGEIFHCHSHDCGIAPGKLLVIDAGLESNSHYASDFTRTYPTGGKFTSKQRDVYQIVCDCNEYAFNLTAPGKTYREIHIAVARKMLEGLSSIGIIKGSDFDTMALEGVAGLFMPHGLGHNMGLDVHDMENLGEDLVGYDPDQKRADQLGLGSLRMARRLVPGHVISDEPGIYFIPQLIEKWESEGKFSDFINYAKLREYFDFGGIRLEDDVVVTADGARRLGANRLPITPDDVEYAMKND